MKTARFALLNGLFLLFMLTACQNDIPASPDEAVRNEYAVNWVKTFGLIDTEQDWNMATSITAEIDPSAFGDGYIVNIYNADPLKGGVLIGRAYTKTTLSLDVAKDATTVFVRAYTPDRTMFTTSEYSIVDGKVNIRALSRGEMSLSRADDQEEPTGYQWILACEDLGSVGDYDFNDIVIGVNYVAGDRKLTVTPLAAGGVYKANVCFGDEVLFESHKLISGEDKATGTYTMVNTYTWGGPGSPSAVRNGVDFSITDKMGALKIKVIKSASATAEAETIIESPQKGTAPQIICVRGDWEWPKEGVNIQTAYPGFTDWSKNSSTSDWNKVKAEGQVVKRVTSSTPVVKHNSLKITTTDGEPYYLNTNCSFNEYGGLDNCSTIKLESGVRYYFDEPWTSCAYMFCFYKASISNLKTVDISDFDTSHVADMQCMFANCTQLEEIILGDIDTSNVTCMNEMFADCRSLTSIDLSHFDTSKVIEIGAMFCGCSSLTTLDLSNFDTSKVTYMENMFGRCSSLTTLDLSNFDTSKVTLMDFMFERCSSLTTLDISNFDTSNVTNMSYMFAGCPSLTTLDISNFDTSNVTNMSYMFAGCSSLTTLDLSNFDTSKVERMFNMFSGCSSLEKLNIHDFSSSSLSSWNSMFLDCPTDMSIYTNDTFKTWCISNALTNNLPENVVWLSTWP